jgi:hypothetical protein
MRLKSKFLILCAVGACVALLCPALASAQPATPILGSAQSFAVLGAAGVTNAHSDPNPQTQIYGNVGVDPGPLTAITGFPPGIVTGGSKYGPSDPSLTARLDATNAYNTLAALPFISNLTGQDLGGRTLTPGVYYFSSTAFLTGIVPLTLDFQGNPNADFVFQVGTALTTGSSSVVNVINGDSTSGVYWLMGVTGGSGTGSATLGSDTVFAGNIIALDSISLDPRAEILCGRAFALTGSVTLIDNLISNNNTAQDFGSGRSDFGSYGFSGSPAPVPLPAGILLLGSGLVRLAAYRKRSKKA